MTELISKVQYRNFEAGEFTAVAPRSYEELIALAESFPWQQERENIAIGLTNPSITIEGRNGDFLKLTTYYNQKFVLYYLDGKGQLFSKSFFEVRDAYPYFQRFLAAPVMEPTGFKRENRLFLDDRVHFETRHFNYFLTSRSIARYLWSTSGFNFCLTLIILCLLGWKGFSSFNTEMLFFQAVTIIVFGGGIHLVFFFNYYRRVKNSILVISRGNPLFSFGVKGNVVLYNKKDIVYFVVKRAEGSRNMLGVFAYVELGFKDGALLEIPNLLINEDDMVDKLFDCKPEYQDELPFL